MIDQLYKIFKSMFPEYEPREGQLETAAQIIDAYEDGIRHVVLEAPTGSGKSIILGLVFEYYANKGKRCIATTVSKALQDQYSRDFDFADIRSSGDERYRCQFDHTRKELECVAKSEVANCRNKTDCPYGRALTGFMFSKKSLTNLQFASRVPHLNNPYILAIDECHEIGNIIIGAVSVEFKEANLELLSSIILDRKEYEDFVDMYTQTKQELESIDKGVVFKMPNIGQAGHATYILDRWVSKLEANAKQLIANTTMMKSAYKHAKAIVNMLKPIKTSIGKLFVAEGNMKFTPVYASSFARPLLFSKASKLLHMSATICGYEAYCDEVGIDIENARFVTMKHMIPIKNRQIKFVPAAYMSFKNYDTDIAKTVSAIDNLIKRHDRCNTIIHTVSYKRADDIASRSKFKIQVPRSHAEVVKLLLSAKNGVYIASPSIVAGIDAKDDMCRLNIIAKLPFPSLGSPRYKYLLENEPRQYSLSVARDIVQASGRSSRHENDYSMTYFIDGMFRTFCARNDGILPEWFKEAIDWSEKI